MILNNDLDSSIFQDIFCIYPSPVFIMTSKMEIIYWNKAAEMFANKDTDLLHLRGGEALKCINVNRKNRCGESENCPKCEIRNSVQTAIMRDSAFRTRARLEIKKEKGGKRNFYALITTSPVLSKNQVFALMIIEDINNLIEIEELVPICAWCKKIRNDKNYWDSVENYLKSHLDLSFSHSICPDCYQKIKGKYDNQ